MNTDQRFVVTIARELGSGGRTIGRKLAARLGVRYSDKDLINTLVKEFDLSVEEIERIKGRRSNWLTDFLERIAPMPTTDTQLGAHGDEFVRSVTSDTLYEAECAVLKDLAKEESLVIAGRSAFFILDGFPNKIDILIVSEMKNRIARVMERYQVDEKTAVAKIKEADAQRENFIKHYAKVSRYDARNYDMTLYADEISEDDAVELIMQYIKMKP